MKKDASSQDTSTETGHTIYVQFAELCCAIVCHDTDIFQRLKESYQVFRTDSPADVTIRLDFNSQFGLPIIKTLPSEASVRSPEEQYVATNELFDISFDAASHAFLVTTNSSIFDTSFKLKPMNLLLSLAYYTISKLKHKGRPSGMLVHSCGILRNGKVALFTGPMDIGKSTVGRLCPEDYGPTLNDEMMLLSWLHGPDKGVMVHNIPIFGDLPSKSNVSAPLAYVMMLKQSQRIDVRRLSRKEAFLRFIYQIITPDQLLKTDKRENIALTAEFADEITEAVPFYELEFTRDRNLLWEVETRITEINGKEEVHDRRSVKAG